MRLILGLDNPTSGQVTVGCQAYRDAFRDLTRDSVEFRAAKAAA
jgi:hypothetical protein